MPAYLAAAAAASAGGREGGAAVRGEVRPCGRSRARPITFVAGWAPGQLSHVGRKSLGLAMPIGWLAMP